MTYCRPLERRYSSREPRPMNSVTRNILLRPFLSSMTRPSRRTRFSCCSDLKEFFLVLLRCGTFCYCCSGAKLSVTVAPVRNFALLLLKCAIFLVLLRCGTFCNCCSGAEFSVTVAPVRNFLLLLLRCGIFFYCCSGAELSVTVAPVRNFL